MSAQHTFARPTPADAESAMTLLNACNMAEYGVAETTIEDVRGDWADIDLSRDAWLALDETGALRGYVYISPEGDRVNCDYYVLPDPAWAPLAEALLAAAEARARELIAADPALRPLAFTVQSSLCPAAAQAALARGWALQRYHFKMSLALDRPPEAPVWPAGIALRTVRPGVDDERLHALVQRAFDRPGRVPQPLGAWRSFMMREDHFRPDLWFLAEDGAGELCGAALCFDYPEQGWVRQLAVAEPWRRRGLGSALLRHAFQTFYAAGKPEVGLAVLSENERAYRLYEQVGMHRARQYDEYEKALTP